MSFINFMIHGSNSPAFEAIHPDNVFGNIGIQHGEDKREYKDITNPILNFNETNILLDSNQKPLITLDFSCVRKANQTWKKFQKYASYLSYFSTFASLGLLSWKALSARSFVRPGLLNVVGAVAFGALALKSYFRGAEAAQLFDSHVENTINDIVLNFNYFRKCLFNLESYDDAIYSLPGALRSRGRALEFLTENEKSYIIPKLINSDLSKKENVESLRDFCTVYKIAENTPKFDSALIKFSNSLNFDEMQDDVAKLYHDWVDENILPSIKNLMDSTSFTNEEDRNFATLFEQCYREEFESYCPPDSEDYPAAFGEVCKTISSKLQTSDQAAIAYIDQHALADFKIHLYASGFKQQFRDVLKQMDDDEENKEVEITANQWLQYQFKTIKNETIKTILLESLELKPSEQEDLFSWTEEKFEMM